MSDERRDIVQDGLEAEKRICNHYDSLTPCMNPDEEECSQKPLTHPCKKTFKKVMRDLVQYYVDIVNSVQMYSKCNFAFVFVFILASIELSTVDSIINVVRVLWHTKNAIK